METTESMNTCREFLERIHKLPDGRKIDQCLQCGTCSASCPTAEAMDYSPREIIAALRAGMLDRVLKSNTVWFCSSCYMCAVRCPAGIPFTDVMYELKRLGVKYDIHPKDATNAVMARSFVHAIDRYGRNAEAELIRNYYLRTNPFKVFSQFKLASKLFFTGRIKLSPEKIKGLDGLRKMMATVEEEDET